MDIKKKTIKSPPPPKLKLPSIMQKMKSAYQLWYEYYQILPKNHRHSVGQKVDTLFADAIETVSIAIFLSPEEKTPYIRLVIRKINTLNIFLMILWENKSLDNKKYIALSEKIDEIGKILGGWLGQITKQNSPGIKPREK